MLRPAHYREYDDMTEVIPGVFVDTDNLSFCYNMGRNS